VGKSSAFRKETLKRCDVKLRVKTANGMIAMNVEHDRFDENEMCSREKGQIIRLNLRFGDEPYV